MFDICFSESKEINLKINIPEAEDINCTLHISNNSYPYVIIDQLSRRASVQALKNHLSVRENILHCKHQHMSLVLVDCKIDDIIIYPEFIYYNDSCEVNSMSVSINGLYDFFNGMDNFDFVDGNLQKEVSKSFLDFDFKIGGEDYHLDIQHWASLDGGGRKITIEQDAVIKLSKAAGTISLSSARELSKNVCGLFSLLLGFNLSINKVWLCASKDDYARPFYFYASSEKETPFKSWTETFIQSPNIFDNIKWKGIFEAYFSEGYKKLYNRFWVRVIQLFSYKGFWEYEILAVFSIIEAYSCHSVESDSFKKKFREYLNHLPKIQNGILNEIEKINSKLSPLTKREREIIGLIQRKVINKKTNPSFNVIFDYFLQFILPAHIQKILNLSKEDISIVKKTRDAAAHALPMDSIRKEINSIQVIKNKITILLMYLSLSTLGMSDEVIISIIFRSHYSRKIQADLSDIEMRSFLNYQYIYKVSALDLENISNINGFNVPLIYSKSTNTIDYNNDDIKSLMVDWAALTKDKSFVHNEELKSFILDNFNCGSVLLVDFLDEIYFHNGNKNTKLIAPILITIE